jgi:hypothetical protein
VTIVAAAPYLTHMTKHLIAPIAAALTCSAVFASAAAASCMPTNPTQQRARAAVIFDGVAQDGPTATGIVKGQGPRVVRVDTGFTRRADGTITVTTVSLVVHRGEHWRIFGRGSARMVIHTNVCEGSAKR